MHALQQLSDTYPNFEWKMEDKRFILLQLNCYTKVLGILKKVTQTTLDRFIINIKFKQTKYDIRFLLFSILFVA